MKGEKTKSLWQNPEYRRRMSEAHKGHIPTNMQDLLDRLKGNKYSVGRVPWNKGINGVSAWNKGKKFLAVTGENNPNWRGDAVGYFALHHWVRRALGTATECVSCGKTEGRIHWASVSHNARRDLNDYVSLCAKCHREYDRERR